MTIENAGAEIPPVTIEGALDEVELRITAETAAKLAQTAACRAELDRLANVVGSGHHGLSDPGDLHRYNEWLSGSLT